MNESKTLLKKLELEALLKLKKQHKKQKEATKSDKSIRALFWGNRVGKTRWSSQEVVRYAFGMHEYRDIKAPIEIWCACPSFDQQKDTTQKTLEELIPRHLIKDISWIRKGVWSEVILTNGSRITFKSYEQGREKFQGVGKRLIWFDEEPPQDIWEECFVRRSAGEELDIILSMTAVKGMTWIYDDIYLATDNQDIFVSTAGWDDNPWLGEEQKEQMARGLSADALKVRKEGKFVRRVGLVCNWWSRDVHLQDIEYNPNWLVTRVIDFGWSRSKTCVLWIGRDSDDVHHIFDGIYKNKLIDGDLAKLIKEREQNYNIVNNIADNQPDRMAVLEEKGIAINAVVKKATGDTWDEKRAEAMSTIGKVDKVTNRSRFVVSTKLVEYSTEARRKVNWFVHEIEALRWKEKRVQGGYREVGKWDKESAKGHHFDAIDCFSYYAAEQQKLSSNESVDDDKEIDYPKATQVTSE